MKLDFEKYQALGNDFIVVEVPRPDTLGVAQAIHLCDRHFGIGADGVLLVSSPHSAEARATMSVINADGSRPEMCGNGLRCVALHLARSAREDTASFIVDTHAGPRRCEVEARGEEGWIKSTMGQGRREGVFEHSVRGEPRSFQRVSMGNPHAISFGQQVPTDELDRVGAELNEQVAGGINVEIATPQADGSIVVSVFERGVGRTLACGTGAAATAVAAVLAEKAPMDHALTIHLPGGDLDITVREDLQVDMAGPACWVYAGGTQL